RRGLHADHRQGAPAAAGAPGLRRKQLRHLQLRAAQGRLPRALDPGALLPLERRLRRGDVLLRRRLRGAQGLRHRTGLDQPAPGRPPARPAAGRLRALDRCGVLRRARGHGRHLPAARARRGRPGRRRRGLRLLLGPRLRRRRGGCRPMGALTPEHPLLAGLCDDAAVFPPGNLPLAEAVPAHLDHALGAHAALVGPFVLAAKDLPSLAEMTAGLPEAGLELALTSPLPDLAGALEHAGTLPAVRVVALEVALPEDATPGEVVPTLDTVLSGRERLSVAVEVPRDGRRAGVVAALPGTRYTAKLRTGGVRAELYPAEAALAAAVAALVAAGVPFKATAGLHHALRNTDPDTGFEQHGYLNLL